MTSFATGRRAEAAAAAFLVRKGCDIIAQNWRTRMCEIDIVAMRDGVVYFCEVKYRQSDVYGSGIEYIMPKKVHQMRFAAETWVHVNHWQGDCELVAIEVSAAYTITNIVREFT